MAEELQPLPEPGVAIFPHLIAKQPMSLLMKGEYFGDNSVTTMEAEPIFVIKNEAFSMSHRNHIIDARSGQELCTLRKKTWTTAFHHYAETKEGGPHLFDLESRGSSSHMHFANAADQGKPMVIDYNRFGKVGIVYISGRPVAKIERKAHHTRTTYHIHITSRLDIFLIVALSFALQDKRESESDRELLRVAAHTAGGGGGGGGA